MSLFSKFFLKAGALKSVVLVTFASIVLSLIFTYSSVALIFGLPQPEMSNYLLIAALVPLFVAPMVSFGFINLMFKINKLETENRHLATYDALTGLLSRSAFYNFAELQHKIARRECGNIAILFADLDGFKQINDSYGHGIGDAVLKEFAKIILATVRSSDIVGRVGGDEFIFCLPNTNSEEASELGNRLVSVVNSTIYNHEANQIKLSVSIGLFADEVNGDMELADFIRKADVVLNEAKRSGKNQLIQAVN
jgi:diguanylate cyclase (GGDEF)-like protein